MMQKLQFYPKTLSINYEVSCYYIWGTQHQVHSH